MPITWIGDAEDASTNMMQSAAAWCNIIFQLYYADVEKGGLLQTENWEVVTRMISLKYAEKQRK